MPAEVPSTGAGWLVRAAGLPARLWTRIGNPELFTGLRERVVERTAYAEFAATLADRLGAELIPHPYLDRTERGGLLALRRRLHRGQGVPEATCYQLAGAVCGLSPELADDLMHAGDWSTALAARDERVRLDVEREQARLSGLPWELVISSPLATRAVAEAAPGMMDDIRRRLAFGENWGSKRLRHRADYLTRVLARGTTKPTPRGWLGHVGLLAVGGRSGNWTRVETYAAHWTSTAGTSQGGLTEVGATLAMAGLHWVERDQLCCWVVDPLDRAVMRKIMIRRTPELDAVRRVLEAGAVSAEDVVRRLCPDADQRRHDVLRGFLSRLVGLGVLELSIPSPSRLTRWGSSLSVPAGTGSVDVFCRLGGTMPGPMAGRLQGLVAQATRVGAVLAAAAPDQREHPVLTLVGAEPRPVTEVLAEYLREHQDSAGDAAQGWDSGLPRERPAWPAPPADRACPYGRLLALMDSPADQVTITPDMLDEIGAPEPVSPTWPADCLVRPIGAGGAYGAVLEAVAPAGIVDARFAGALHQLHGDVPQVSAYRVFLGEMANRCGAEFVEILAPPLDDEAPSAVHRPPYCPVWTGDPNAGRYQRDEGRYLPLDRITVRRVGDRIVAEDADGPDGMVLWPMYHATRRPRAPWGVMVSLLSAASPARLLTNTLVLGSPMSAFPGRDRLPRLVLAGGLVLTGAQWRIGKDRLPDPEASFSARISTLAALRIGTHMPRWVFVRAEGGHQPQPVDLDSLGALRTLEKLLTSSDTGVLVFEEMLPDPDHLPLRDADGNAVAGQLLARLPYDVAPNRLAATAALAWNRLVNDEHDRSLPRQRDWVAVGAPVRA